MEKTFQGLIISLLNYTEIFGGFKNFLSYYLISYFYFMVGIMANSHVGTFEPLFKSGTSPP